MPDGFDLATNAAPIASLLAVMDSGAELAGKLTKLRRQQERAEQVVRDYQNQLDALFDDIRRSGHTVDWILEAAEVVRRRELTERERLAPGLDSLRRKLAEDVAPIDVEVRQLLEQSAATAETWVELPATLHEKLLKLARERRAAAERTFYAHPVEGAIESDELTRRIIRRFPKILAELAK
jgi:predicted  nucleic acid-binding Zn-ribbon protein